MKIISSSFILATLVCFIFIGGLSIADTPLPAPKSYVTASLNRQYIAEVNWEDKITTIFEIDRDKTNKELWKMHGWFRSAYLSNDGHVIAIPYNGLNLLSPGFRKTEVMLKLARGGKLVRIVRLNELIDDFDSLRQTVSHFAWGAYKGFDEKGDFIIETEEGWRFHISPDTKPVRKEKVPSRSEILKKYQKK